MQNMITNLVNVTTWL